MSCPLSFESLASLRKRRGPRSDEHLLNRGHPDERSGDDANAIGIASIPKRDARRCAIELLEACPNRAANRYEQR
jgi:hypothetical protein